jgi:hypothetical protein
MKELTGTESREIAEVYAALPENAAEAPGGWSKVKVNAGESKEVVVEIVQSIYRSLTIRMPGN